jgi:hypothetical protein
MDWAEYIERLIGELRKLTGWGATPTRLVTCWALREALGIPEDMPNRDAGPRAWRKLKAAIHSLDGTYNIRGYSLSADQVRMALVVTLRFDKWNWGAEDRRIEAMKRLKVSFSSECWRREFGPERDLLAILAEGIAPQGALVPVA